MVFLIIYLSKVQVARKKIGEPAEFITLLIETVS